MRAFSALLAPWLLLALACSSLPAKAPRVGPGQYLFRVEARSQEREAHLRVVLRFAGERRFQIGAADLVGRTVWTFAVAGDHFLWADHRQRKVCRGEASEALALPLLQLELSPGAVPQILLGALPIAIPAEAAKGTDGRVRFVDGAGHHWLAGVDSHDELREWQMSDSTGRTIATWQRDGGTSELALPQRELTLRWRQASAEPLPGDWAPFATPDGFEECGCDQLDLP
ncbi:MAG: hypothetical protein IPJ17_14260 [Holophagales bacterium]|nr:MAG: hypothetical protein IPJ17_14260 [Holophagales bacterium]